MSASEFGASAKNTRESQKRPLAVVTGASAGIGHSLARALARRGFDLWIVARRADRLEEVAHELEGFGARVHRFAADLGDERGPRALLEAIDERGVAVDLFVNNAGFGYFGEAVDEPLEQAIRMVRLNVEAVAVLSIAMGRRMRERGRGGLITVASTAGFQATPYHALYGATKGFDLLFSEALAVELAGTGVRVMALCPGYTRTEFQALAGVPVVPPAMMIGDADDCAAQALDAFARGETVFVHGAVNRLGPLAARILPRSFVANAGARMFRPKR